MLLAEFDAEKYERTIRQEGLEEGIEQGREQGIRQGRKQGIEQGRAEGKLAGMVNAIIELLEDFGQIPSRLLDLIQHQKDPATLSRWHKLAARLALLFSDVL